MHTFQTDIVWRNARQCSVRARGNPELTVAAPPEFGGPEGVWSPEQLLAASIGSCLLSTFLAFAERFRFALDSYVSTSAIRTEKTSEGLRLTAIEVSIAVTVTDDATVERISSLRLRKKLEKHCPVSAALNCPVQLVLHVIRHVEHQGAGRAEPAPR